MKTAAKMMAVTSATRSGDRGGSSGDRGGRSNMEMGYYPRMTGYDMEDNYRVDDRFRDRRGREHYDNGRFAPRNESTGTLTWDTTHERENDHKADYGEMNRHRYDDSRMNYPRSEMDEPESRRRYRRDSRGRFRSEMEEPNMHYPDPRYPPPVYEEPNRIGFAAHDGSERSNLHMIRGGTASHEMELDEKTAHEWMENLQNEDGTKGPHWTKEQTTQVLKQKNINCDPLEFWVAMNAMYSDYVNVAKKSNVNNVDFYVNMAKAFLDDKDAGEGKLASYYEYIVK